VRNIVFGPLLRLLPVGLVVLSIQRVFFAQHPIHDVRLQFVLALVVAAGAGGGAERGAIAGVALGLVYDLSGNTPLGLMALAYGLGGMTAGYVHTFTPDPQWWLASLFALVGAAVGEMSIPVAEVMTGQSGWITGRLVITIPVVAGTAAVLCPLLMPVGRWMMGVKRKKWKAMLE
jgi:cell shape-determining protein MreD